MLAKISGTLWQSNNQLDKHQPTLHRTHGPINHVRDRNQPVRHRNPLSRKRKQPTSYDRAFSAVLHEIPISTCALVTSGTVGALLITCAILFTLIIIWENISNTIHSRDKTKTIKNYQERERESYSKKCQWKHYNGCRINKTEIITNVGSRRTKQQHQDRVLPNVNMV